MRSEHLPTYSTQIPTTITFGSGSQSTTTTGALLGPLQAAVLPDVIENLISPNGFIDHGATILLDASGGFISHPAYASDIPLVRVDNTWRIWLSDIQGWTASDSEQHLKHHSNSNRASALVGKARMIYGRAAIDRFIHLHSVANHPNLKQMLSAVSGDRPSWRNCGLTPEQLSKIGKSYKCPDCILSKRHFTSPAINLTNGGDEYLSSATARPGDIISADYIGPIKPTSSTGYTGFFLFKDVCTGYGHCVCVSSKATEHFLDALTHTLAFYSHNNLRVRILRTDDENILQSRAVEHYCNLPHNSIKLESSIPYQHWQNSVERDVQTVVRGVSTLLHAQVFLSAAHWDLALFHYIHLRNRTPNSRTYLKSPHQIITGEPLDFTINFRHSFGDLVAVSIPASNQQWKFDLKHDLGVYVGDSEKHKRGELVYYPATRNVNVRYGTYPLELTDKQFLHYLRRREYMREGDHSLREVRDALIDFTENAPTADILHENLPQHLPPLRANLADEDEVHDGSISNRTRSKRVRSATAVNSSSNSSGFNESISINYHDSLLSNCTDTTDVTSPAGLLSFTSDSFSAYGAKITVGKALKTDQRSAWITAMQSEMDQLFAGGTLSATTREEIPANSTIIHSTMQLKEKLKADGTVDKLKARLCACGNELYGSNTETYSPTISALAYATVHQISIIDKMESCTIDTVGAYLYQNYPDSEPPLYIILPSNVSTALHLDPSIVYRIRKYLYGLPDAGRAYYKAYSELIISNGYQRSASDPCLFVRTYGSHRTYIWIHVDDTFVTSTSAQELDNFQKVLKTKFEITVNSNVREYLGIKMEPLTDGSVRLTQPKLLDSLFDEYSEELETSHRSINTPQRLSSQQSNDKTPMAQGTYLHLLGALIYLLKSRPDIATAISFGSTYAAHPTVAAFHELLHCLRYLFQTRDKGLILRTGVPGQPLHLTCYVDASYLTHSDSKSHTGYCLSFGEIGTFYSKSSKQTLVATSSTHAELRALYTLLIEVIFVINLCDELHRPVELPAVILEDNQPVIDVTADVSSRAKKCKHFLMLVNYVKEQVAAGLISIQKVHTSANIADVLTKALIGNDFTLKASKLLGEVAHNGV